MMYMPMQAPRALLPNPMPQEVVHSLPVYLPVTSSSVSIVACLCFALVYHICLLQRMSHETRLNNDT